MAMKEFGSVKLNRKNWNLIAGIVLFFVISFVIVFCLSITPAVALEQELRCGMEEHVHQDQCYDGDFLVCTKQAHTHNGNCYIVLLNENDINEILSLVEESETQSLETVITDVVTTALTFNRNLNSSEAPVQLPAEAEPVEENEEAPGTAENATLPESKPETMAETLSQSNVILLNDTIAEDETLPDLVLNENLNTEDTVIQENAINQQAGGAATLGVGDTASTSNYDANFYIYLDGQWTCIGTLPFTRTQNGNRYYSTIATSEVLNLVNSALGTEYDYNSFDISVSSSLNGTYSRSYIGMASVTTTIGYRQNNINSRAAKYVRLIPNNGAANSTGFAFYTVKFIYPNGTTITQYIRSGTSVAMPAGNYQWISGGDTYSAGENVIITGTTTFTGVLLGNPTYIDIYYDVNFPEVSGVTYTAEPTLAGLSSATVRDEYTENSTVSLRNVSRTSVQGSVNGHAAEVSRTAQFKGWRVGDSDIILQPNTRLIWEELMQYSKNSTTLRLYGVWETDAKQTASFFIRFDSVAVDTEGNITGQDRNKYTDELFAAHVGGIDTSLDNATLNSMHYIADTTSDNSYGADQEIRALYGEQAGEIWLGTFPTDDYIFSRLVEYAQTGYLSVDGVAVKAEDLNDREYAIRWYVFKYEGDSWHIDGKLVKKEGLIHVYKSFAGNKELIASAKEGFYIDALDEKDRATTVLNLDNAVSYDAATDTYMWEITNVEYGEPWTLTEYPAVADLPDGYSVFSGYTIMDPHGGQSGAGSGTSLTVNGMTYALDEDVDEVLCAEFTNIYNRNDSIIIKKQDSRTGVSIGGATFQLLQNGKVLKFNYNSETDSYEYAPDHGTQTILSGTANGYFEICIEDFSYDAGPVTIREITAPTGYAPIGDIEIGYIGDRKTVGILSGNSELIKYINGILIVGNSTDVSSVTAKKEWDCPQSEWQDVTIQLFADGKLVTTVIAGVQPEVVLNNDNHWQYTWDNLPVYVNGSKIDWSIKEVKVGTEAAKADGSFVNWLVSYSIPVKTTDTDGNEKITLTVTNTTKRVMLRLTKTNLGKSILLPNAAFVIEAVDADGNILPEEVTKSAATGTSGTLIFDNLKCNVRYRLTETTPPAGYLPLEESIYFTINEDGSVTVEESFYAEAGTTAYNITVFNAEAVELPESGGPGDFLFYAAGLLMILVACRLYKGALHERRCQK